jgi:hypothetical protein
MFDLDGTLSAARVGDGARRDDGSSCFIRDRFRFHVLYMYNLYDQTKAKCVAARRTKDMTFVVPGNTV